MNTIAMLVLILAGGMWFFSMLAAFWMGQTSMAAKHLRAKKDLLEAIKGIWDKVRDNDTLS